jgi:hypothetical protein
VPEVALHAVLAATTRATNSARAASDPIDTRPEASDGQRGVPAAVHRLVRNREIPDEPGSSLV